MRVQSVEFVKGVARIDQLPQPARPEVAFLGPSNVGKSSLVNSLLGRRSLARVSKTPGRTQQLNFFLVNGNLHFVDLPGYGYARAPEAVRRRFLGLVEDYLEKSEELRLLVLLLDARRAPSARDVDLRRWCEETGLPHVVVLTKSDKLPRGRLARSVAAAEKALGLEAAGARALPYSARTGQGRRELWGAIEAAVSPPRGEMV